MIASWAYGYIGLEYSDACWGPDYFDCWGLLAKVYKDQFNFDVIDDMAVYKSRQDKVKRLHEYLHFWKPVDDPQEGDAILFLIHGNEPHCAVYVGEGRMLHIVEGISACIQRIDDIKWKSRFEGYYRYSSSSS